MGNYVKDTKKGTRLALISCLGQKTYYILTSPNHLSKELPWLILHI